MAFIDLTKAFGSINREALWKVLSRFGCPANFITILRLLHDKMTATALFSETETEPFTIRTGVKQGCVIAPTLFTVYLCVILFLVRDRLPHGIELDSWLDGRLFNLGRLKAKTKVMKTAALDLQYADDCAILVHSAEELQTSLDLFTEAYQSLGLSINNRKAKVINQPTPGINAGPPEIKVSGGIVEVVEHFPYLPSHLSQKATIDAEIQHHICCACTSFRKLCHRVFVDHNIRKETKVIVYKAICITTLLYGSEAWVTYRCHLKTLETFHQRCLRKILHIWWEGCRTNGSVLTEANTTSIEAMIVQNQLTWTGHCQVRCHYWWHLT